MGGCVGKKEEKGERHRAWVSALLRDVSVRCFVLRRERKSSVYYVSKRKRMGIYTLASTNKMEAGYPITAIAFLVPFTGQLIRVHAIEIPFDQGG